MITSELPPQKNTEIRRSGLPWPLGVLAGLLVTFAVVWMILYVTKGRILRGAFERTLSAQLHRQVHTQGDFQLFFDPLQIQFVAEGLTIANPPYATNQKLLSARRLAMRIAPLSLFREKWRIPRMTLENATLDLEWSSDHKHNSWTFGDKKGGKPLTFPVIDRALLTGTTVRYRDPRLHLLTDLRFETIQSRNAHIGTSVTFAGKGQIRSTPFSVSGALLSPDQTVERGQNRLSLHAIAASNVIDMTGTLPSLAALENVPLRVAARGANLARLLEIIGVVVPETRRYALTSKLILNGSDYRFSGMRGRFGDSDLSGDFTVHNVEPRVKVDADLRTHQLDIVDAAPFIGYNPDAVAARGAAAAVTHVHGTPRILPDAPLKIEALRAFDAGLLWHVDAVRSRNAPLSDIDLNLLLDDGLLKLSPLTLTMARGRVSSNITINARARPAHTTYDIHLLPTPLGKLLSGFGAIQAGTTGVIKGRIELTGDGDSVRSSLASSRGRMAFVLPAGSLWIRNALLSELNVGGFVQRMLQNELKKPVGINCGLVAFTVRDGTAMADPILIDTAKNVITARGGFSFKDERIDLSVRANAKKFSLLSGQSPIGLQGYFAAPTIRPISPQLLARAGVGVGLAVLAPPAALLAFVDPGDAKSTACGPVLMGARATAQTTVSGQPIKYLGDGTTKSEGRKKFLGIF